MKILKIYSGFFLKNFYISYDEEKFWKINVWDLTIFQSWENKFRWEIKNIFKYSEDKNTQKKIANEEECKFLRICNDEDLKEIQLSIDKENEFLKFFRNHYEDFKITLEPNSCEVSHDDKMLLFSYTSEERVDFRELVKFLASKFRRRIQLKHIWTRDKAAVFWGFWVCGRELCCSKFLKNTPIVPIHAPKVQDLMYKDTDNLLWVCGKLKCCLNYEVQQYQEIKKNFPNIWTSVFVDDKKWIIIWVDIFSQKVKLKFQDSAKIFDLSEIKEFLEQKKSFNSENKTWIQKNEWFKKFEKKDFKKPFQKTNFNNRPKKEFKDLKKNNHHINSHEKKFLDKKNKK